LKEINENKILIIGIILSVVLHGTILASLLYFNTEKKKPEEEEKIVYINIVKPKKKENTTPKVKKKIPQFVDKKQSKPVQKDQPKPKPKPKPKPEPKPEPKPVPATEIVKREEKKEIPQIKKEDINSIKEKIEKIPIEESQTPSEPFSVANLAGKDLLYQHGEESLKEEKKESDESVLLYIQALQRYLNELTRKRDLYPPMAKRLRIEGSLVVRFTIKADGSLDGNSIQIIDSSNFNVLDKGAVKLIKKYVPEFARKYKQKPPKGDLTIELPITFEIIGW